MSTASSPKADGIFIALSHPTRRQILRAIIVEGELSPEQLASRLGQSPARLSYHVRTMAEHGALELGRTEQVRGSTQHFYRSIVEAPWVPRALVENDGPSQSDPTQGGESPN